MVNEGMRSWGHTFLYDEPELVSALNEVGFAHVVRVQWQQSSHADMTGLERRSFHGDLILEATK
jgi:hypothetical protein